jgi:RimJ/RimL family protein N-acetyltransferase
VAAGLFIRSERLILRPVGIEDAEVLFGYRSNAIINQYQGWIPETVADVREFIQDKVCAIIDQPNTWFQLAIVRKDTGKLIGDVGIHFLEPDSLQAEIGCTLNFDQHGNGFATEALTETLNFLFRKLNKHRVIASIDPRNKKSIKLVERIGMRKEAHFRRSLWINNEWVDDLVYAILKEDWPEE